MRYQGLVLYLKEMDEDRYQRLCTVSRIYKVISNATEHSVPSIQNYTSTISGLHQDEMKDLLMNLMGVVNASIGQEANEACKLFQAGDDVQHTLPSMKSPKIDEFEQPSFQRQQPMRPRAPR